MGRLLASGDSATLRPFDSPRIRMAYPFLKIQSVKETHHHVEEPQVEYVNVNQIKLMRSKTVLWHDGKGGAVDKEGNGVQSINDAARYETVEMNLGYGMPARVFAVGGVKEIVNAIRKLSARAE